MCQLCDLYGNGEIWYFNPKNFSRRMYKVRRTGERRKGYGEDPELAVGYLLDKAVTSKWEDPENHAAIVKQVDEEIIKSCSIQVLPLEDALRVMEIAYPIASMMCLCRKMCRAAEETNEQEYTCTATGVGVLKWERWPERYRGGVNFMTSDEAKEYLIKMNKKGFVHLIMGLEGNYIGGVCNCDYPDCLAIRYRLDYGLTSMLLKAHYIAKVDYEICNGCAMCVQRCQFGAIKFERTIKKPNIDMMRCFGCGLCETGCSRKAITLVDKSTYPGLKDMW